MKQFFDHIVLRLAPCLGALMIRFLHRCIKPDIVNAEFIEQRWREHKNSILVSWHDQLLMMPPFYRGESVKILISASRDGELIARTVHYFGLDTVRGSSSRGGREALLQMSSYARQNHDLGITPDGPKGPRHQVKSGLAILAQKTGLPVVPLAFACSSGHRFASWDRFLIPYPWSKAVYHLGDPVVAGSNEPLDHLLERLQNALDENTQAAHNYLKKHDLSAI